MAETIDHFTAVGLEVVDMSFHRSEDLALVDVSLSVVFRDQPSLRDSRVGWVHSAPPGTEIDLTDIAVGRAYKADGRWNYSASLFT